MQVDVHMTMASTAGELLAFEADAFLSRCMGNVALAERLLAKFQENSSRDLDSLEQAWGLRSGEQLRRLAHRLKGSSANMSALQIRRRAADIEALAVAERIDEIRQHLDQLHDDWGVFVESARSHGFRAVS